MELKPIIASYSGASYKAIQKTFDAKGLRLVAEVALGPKKRASLDEQTCNEFIEMHVLKPEGSLVRLDTAVFLEADITNINQVALTWGRDLAQQVCLAAAPLQDEAAALKVFVVGMLGINQGLGRLLREEQTSVRWDQFTGKYARSKVDFDEICPAQSALGPDTLNKTILRGDRYTAVFIGPGGPRFLLQASGKDEAYIWDVNKFLTDAYAMLLQGEIVNSNLSAAAEKAGLTEAGQPATMVLTGSRVEQYIPLLHQVTDITDAFIKGISSEIKDLLTDSTSGRQGVPIENMTLHLWRYIRRAITHEMYAVGFFTDCIPETGIITIFFENGVPVFEKLMG